MSSPTNRKNQPSVTSSDLAPNSISSDVNKLADSNFIEEDSIKDADVDAESITLDSLEEDEDTGFTIHQSFQEEEEEENLSISCKDAELRSTTHQKSTNSENGTDSINMPGTAEADSCIIPPETKVNSSSPRCSSLSREDEAGYQVPEAFPGTRKTLTGDFEPKSGTWQTLITYRNDNDDDAECDNDDGHNDNHDGHNNNYGDGVDDAILLAGNDGCISIHNGCPEKAKQPSESGTSSPHSGSSGEEARRSITSSRPQNFGSGVFPAWRPWQQKTPKNHSAIPRRMPSFSGGGSGRGSPLVQSPDSHQKSLLLTSARKSSWSPQASSDVSRKCPSSPLSADKSRGNLTSPGSMDVVKTQKNPSNSYPGLTNNYKRTTSMPSSTEVRTNHSNLRQGFARALRKSPSSPSLTQPQRKSPSSPRSVDSFPAVVSPGQEFPAIWDYGKLERRRSSPCETLSALHECWPGPSGLVCRDTLTSRRRTEMQHQDHQHHQEDHQHPQHCHFCYDGALPDAVSRESGGGGGGGSYSSKMYLTPTQRKNISLQELKGQVHHLRLHLQDKDRQMRELRQTALEHSQQTETQLEEARQLAETAQQEMTSLRDSHEESLRTVAALQQQLEDVKKEMAERLAKAEEVFLEMYKKGRESAIFEREEELELQGRDASGNSRATATEAELRHKLMRTQAELARWQTIQRDATYHATPLPATEAETTLAFLKDSVYHFLSSDKTATSDEHLRAVIRILKFSPEQREKIAQAIVNKRNKAVL